MDDKYLTPNIANSLGRDGRSIYFTMLDLASGYHKVEIEERDIPKTIFIVEYGHY